MTQRRQNSLNSTSYQKVSFVAGALLIFGLLFSYWPRLDFGAAAAGINLKIPLAWLLAGLFVVVSLPVIYKQRQTWLRSSGVHLLTALVAMAALSLGWTDNLVRGASEVALLVAILAIFIAIQAQLSQDSWLRRYYTQLIGVFWAGSLVVSAMAVWQLFAEAYGVSSTYTLLPEAYQSQVFGFARPTGFSLEPEFLASLLLAPVLASAWLILKSKARYWHYLLFIATLTVVTTTISRGAFIALAIGMLVLLLASGASWQRRFATVSVGLFSVGLAVGLLFMAADINSRDNISGQAALKGSVNHVSLGVIDLSESGSLSSSTAKKPAQSKPKKASSHQPGYVESSTISRLSMTNEALNYWAESPRSSLLGIGQGGYGARLHSDKSQHSPTSIVNNQYVTTLTELGALGLIIFITLLMLPIFNLASRSQWLAVAILGAFYVQWLFFSGNINVPHLWVALAIVYGLPRLRRQQVITL